MKWSGNVGWRDNNPNLEKHRFQGQASHKYLHRNAMMSSVANVQKNYILSSLRRILSKYIGNTDMKRGHSCEMGFTKQGQH